MPRLSSPPELEDYRKEILSKRDPKKPCITLCSGTACHATGSKDVALAIERELDVQGLTGEVDFRRTGCHGFCEKGPIVVIDPEKICYLQVTPEDVPAEIVEKEKQIAKQQAIESGKPPEIAEKMVAGKVKKFLAQHALLEQDYVKEDKKKEAELVAKETFRMLRMEKKEPSVILNFYEGVLEERDLISALSPYDFYFISQVYAKRQQQREAARVLAIAYKDNRDTNDAPYILLRLIRALALSGNQKFLKKALFELQKKFPEIKNKAIAILREVKNGQK